VIASILMMGAMQTFFGYKVRICCGLPSVTLLGSKNDWQLILTRLEKIKTWGQEPTQFHDLLKPVISRFVRTFDDPASAEIVESGSKWCRSITKEAALRSTTAGSPLSASGAKTGLANTTAKYLYWTHSQISSWMGPATTKSTPTMCRQVGRLFR
jgi:hypothetical protein